MASSINEHRILDSPSSFSSDDMQPSLLDSCSDDGMSSDEEELVDFLLTGCTDEEDDGVDYLPSQDSVSSQDSTDYSQTSSTDPADAHGMSWKDQSVLDKDAPDPKSFQFAPFKQPGLQLGLFLRSGRHTFNSAIDFFRLFLTTELLMTICIATNQFATRVIAGGDCLSYATGANQTWEPVTEDEMSKFIGILIFMSLVRCHSIAAYWSESPVYKNFMITKVMSRSRFQAILSFLQITPSADIDKEDKLTRVRPLIDHVRNRSQELFQPYEFISGDERILASKHQYSGIRQYCKDKPVKFGLKIFVLACSLTGYTFDFFVYLGKKRTVFVNNTQGLTYNVIMSLISSVSHQGYKLFYDRYFTTKQLIIDLLKVGIFSVGPIKNNNSAMPSVFRDSLRWGKISSRGDFRWERDISKQFVVVQWRDSKVVSIVSTYHSGSDINKCTRTLKDRTGWKNKELLQPQIIHDYNQYMGGVDKSDQYLSKFPCYIRTQLHWWKVLFFHLIDIMVVNSFLLMKEYVSKFSDDFELPVKFGQAEFREYLVMSLLGVNFVDDNINVCMPEFSDSRNRCQYCYAKSKVESKSDAVDIKTFVYCKNCDVFLCLQKNRNCFSLWHLPSSVNIRSWVSKNCRKRTLDSD